MRSRRHNRRGLRRHHDSGSRSSNSKVISAAVSSGRVGSSPARQGNDTLYGKPGKDTLKGGPGNDTLNGRGGQGQHRFRSAEPKALRSMQSVLLVWLMLSKGLGRIDRPRRSRWVTLSSTLAPPWMVPCAGSGFRCGP